MTSSVGIRLSAWRHSLRPMPLHPSNTSRPYTVPVALARLDDAVAATKYQLNQSIVHVQLYMKLLFRVWPLTGNLLSMIFLILCTAMLSFICFISSLGRTRRIISLNANAWPDWKILDEHEFIGLICTFQMILNWKWYLPSHRASRRNRLWWTAHFQGPFLEF